MGKLLISFATVPGRGSERGVGWEFLRAAVARGRQENEQIFAIIDARDENVLRAALHGLDGSGQLTLVPVAIGRALLRRYGDSKSRLTYMDWVWRARIVAKRLVREQDIDLVHQVTFATASMPSALPKRLVRTIWGPVAVPTAPVYSEGRAPTLAERATVRLAHFLASRFILGVDCVIATNQATAERLRTRSNTVRVEPNVFVEVVEPVPHEEHLLVVVGGLINLKRPWIALRALRDERLSGYRLEFIGDGPLRSALERTAESLGLAERVTFSGLLSRADTLARVARARLLLHPSVREGASWAIGEAAACGVAAVVFEGIGADTTARFSGNGSAICGTLADGSLEGAFIEGIISALRQPNPPPSSRWSTQRLNLLLNDWWNVAGS